MPRYLSARQIIYYIYLQTPTWAALRDAVVQRDNHECVLCGRSMSLQVHHKRYPKRLGEEKLNDLITLCRACHNRQHLLKKMKHGNFTW